MGFRNLQEKLEKFYLLFFFLKILQNFLQKFILIFLFLGDDHFDPNHLLAHVQAVKAVEESDRNEEQAKNVKNGPERTTQKVLDDSEESNTIPISAIPTQVNVNQPKSNEQDVGDLGLTVINLQKDARNKQNFKGFVDSDLIDDKPLPFIPTRYHSYIT